MNRTEYKNNFYKEHYERINLAVPKGMKDIIRTLAADKGMSINAYIQDLVRKDQCGMFDTMQVAEKNREMISGITGNMHDGYDIIFKDGHSCHCQGRKKMSGHVSLNTAKKRVIESPFFHAKMCLAQDFKSIAQDTCFRVSYLCVTC